MVLKYFLNEHKDLTIIILPITSTSSHQAAASRERNFHFLLTIISRSEKQEKENRYDFATDFLFYKNIEDITEV